jgi:hypothetical protein
MTVENDILIPEYFEDYLQRNKEVLFTPSGVSMRPFIEGGRDSVIMERVSKPPRKGDILLAQVTTLCGNRTYVLHRLIRMEGETYVLQGDGNLQGEERCRYGDLIGRVAAILTPSGKRKPLTRGFLWHALFPLRPFLLKIYRHSWLKWYYK